MEYASFYLISVDRAIFIIYKTFLNKISLGYGLQIASNEQMHRNVPKYIDKII